MTFQFGKKPQQQTAQPAQEKSAAEVKAERRRVFQEAAELARRRRERIAAVQAGRLPREALDAGERILLASYERREETEQRPGFFERLSRRIAGSGLGTLIASIITASASAPSSCGGAYNPFLLRVAAVLGSLGLVVLAVAVAVWAYRHLFL
ncbi:MAG: hypothetical protein HZC23_00885 [Rhodocyclales bacterium]|nr:hypothetical protein [Rhodocyclales bacterium]